jgi:hypothetical protein
MEAWLEECLSTAPAARWDGKLPGFMITLVGRVDTSQARAAAWKGKRKPPVWKEWEEILKADRRVERDIYKTDKDGNVACDKCGAKWYRRAEDHGLEHICGRGLVQVKEDA